MFLQIVHNFLPSVPNALFIFLIFWPATHSSLATFSKKNLFTVCSMGSDPVTEIGNVVDKFCLLIKLTKNTFKKAFEEYIGGAEFITAGLLLYSEKNKCYINKTINISIKRLN
ncbi:hypothetical protein [Clostridium sp.]